MKQSLEKKILKVIDDNYWVKLDSIQLREPPKKELGDFAFNCWILAKDLRKNPTLIAEELVLLITWIKDIEFVSVDWAYINIKLSKNIYSELFIDLYKKRKK